MMKPKFEPEIALLFGFLIVPLVGASNWLILETGRAGFYPHLRANFFQMLLSILIISGPQGWMTTRLIQIWRKGRFASARALAIGCALFAAVFWAWIFGNPANLWRAPEIAAFAPPMLWSIGFGLFPFLSRAAKD